jgi:hypothetical protein
MNVFLIILIIASALTVVILFLIWLFRYLLCYENFNENDESIFSKKYLYPITTTAEINEPNNVEIQIL